MTGRHRGFLSYWKKAIFGVATMHCVIHREHKVAKKISEKLKDTLASVIKSVHKIKSNALISRIFYQLCIKNDEDF